MNAPETPAATPGQAAYEARQAAKARRMGAPDSEPDSALVAIIGLRWEELPAGMRADEEAGAQAGIAARQPQPAPGPVFDAITAPNGLEFIRADLHDGLVDAVLKNADEDLNGFDGTREQEAEHYVRWLESERERLVTLLDEGEPLSVKPADDVKPAPELAAAMAAAQAALARVLSWFKPEDKFDSYRYAPATRAQLASAYRDGGLDVPEELRRYL